MEIRLFHSFAENPPMASKTLAISSYFWGLKRPKTLCMVWFLPTSRLPRSLIHSLPISRYSSPVVLRGWSLNYPHQYPLGLLEIQTYGPSPRPADSEAVGREDPNLCVRKPSMGFSDMPEFAGHCFSPTALASLCPWDAQVFSFLKAFASVVPVSRMLFPWASVRQLLLIV